MGWMFNLAGAACLGMIPVAGLAQESDRPLATLAANIPVHASGAVSLIDMGAIRRNILIGYSQVEAETDSLAPFVIVGPFLDFDIRNLQRLEQGGRSEFGFSLFDIDKLAGWGELPHTGVIMTGVPTDPAEMDTVLRDHGFAVDRRFDADIWFRGEDLSADFGSPDPEDPFNSGRGRSQRFSLFNGNLLFAPTWTSIEQTLTARSRLTDDPHVAAIFNAAYEATGFGDLTKAVFFQGQPMRSEGIAELFAQGNTTIEQIEAARANAPGHNLAGPPFFTRYAILYWQKGTHMTGALAIPFPSREIAELALGRLEALLQVMPDHQGRLFSDILPSERHFSVVPSNGMFVVLLGFGQDVPPEPENRLRFAGLNPARFLVQLYEYRELDRLIGFANAE